MSETSISDMVRHLGEQRECYSPSHPPLSGVRLHADLRTIRAVIEDIEQGGPIAGALEKIYGLKRVTQ